MFVIEVAYSEGYHTVTTLKDKSENSVFYDIILKVGTYLNR